MRTTACPGVRVLATSRELLGVAGELAWRVPSLAAPALQPPPSAEQVARAEAVQLFINRARLVQPAFALTGRNAAAVAEVCARLDGIPLAIELAAARSTALTAEQIAARLDDRFRLLTGGRRTALRRQQTLQATVDWSHDLLTAPERVLFRRLSVFAGGWTLEAAEAVGAGDGVEGWEVVELLTRLVEKSLVVAEEQGGAARYRLLETVRQYARERLEARGELDVVGRRHAAYYLDVAAEADRHLQGPDQVGWLDRLERDHDNLRAALRWAIERADAELAMRLAASLSYFWYFRGHFSESRALRAAVLALPAGPGLAAPRTELLQGLGLLVLGQGDYPAARAILDEGLAVARRVGDRRLLAATLATLGFLARVQDDYAAARSALAEGLTLARAVGDDFYAGMALHHLGLLALEADHELDTAWALNEQSLALFRRMGNRRMAGVVRGNMGRVARARGDLATARALLAEAVTELRAIGDLGVLPHLLYMLAAVDADAGRPDRAVRLQAAAMGMAEVVGTRVWPVTQRERDGWLGPARAALGEAAFAAAWAEGAALTSEAAVAEALADESAAG